MKFKILLFATIIFLSGCSSKYNLEIKNGLFKEKISINNLSNSQLKYFKNNKLYALMNGVSDFVEYNKKQNDDTVSLSYNYDINNLKNATILKSCFKAYNILDEDGYYIISTSKGIKCAVEEDRVILDDLDITIKTNHVVKDSNANIKSNKKYEYVWHFNKDNYDSANIYLKIYKDKYVFNYDNEFTIMISIIGGIILTILIATFIIVRRVKKASKV